MLWFIRTRNFSMLKPLTAVAVKALGEGRHGVGGSLYLYVRGRSRTWVFRKRISPTRMPEYGLGSYPTVSLAEARDKLTAMKALLLRGLNPRPVTAPVAVMGDMFKQDMLLTHARLGGKPGSQHGVKWLALMNNHVIPVMGDVDTLSMTREHVKAVLERENLWTQHPVTADRLIGMMSKVFDEAIVRRCMTANPPANPAVHATMVILMPPRAKHEVKNHGAIAWDTAPALYQALRQRPEPAARALELFFACPAPRTNEIIGMRWCEIDGAVWTVPKERVKGKNPKPLYRPLIPAARALLASLPRTDERVFSTLHNSSMLSFLKNAMGYANATTHGLRSVWDTWNANLPAAERDKEATEMGLGHGADKYNGAYTKIAAVDILRPHIEKFHTFLTT
jgi:integrase